MDKDKINGEHRNAGTYILILILLGICIFQYMKYDSLKNEYKYSVRITDSGELLLRDGDETKDVSLDGFIDWFNNFDRTHINESYTLHSNDKN